MGTRMAGLALGLVMLGGSWGLGDGPLPPPQRIESWSPDRSVLAVSDPQANVTTVYRVGADGKRARLWGMVGWFRVVRMSNDTKHLVIGYDGENLIPASYRKEMPMLYFVEKGELKAVVTLEELVGDLAKLRRTVSHYEWGGVGEFDEKGELEVSTVNGHRRFAGDGKRVE